MKSLKKTMRPGRALVIGDEVELSGDIIFLEKISKLSKSLQCKHKIRNLKTSAKLRGKLRSKEDVDLLAFLVRSSMIVQTRNFGRKFFYTA
ncbi:hypothetical protein [Novosphingobium humi]|uniref:Uncharacterized protein n=1 Tax=Novosphingobium humi TaxID=2282397 RepID=A0ABY7TYW7_9SPHN|nr:hypothetical protein [Novosphingobium humi]WCT77515.1 hypothetical protein PQ457_00540 [Novosphingobium humi]